MDMMAPNVLASIKALYEDAAREFLTKGYYYRPDMYDWHYKPPCYERDPVVPEPTLRKFVRRVARENKRPFVQMWPYYDTRRVPDADGRLEHKHFRDGIIIDVPRQVRLAPLVTMLQLAACPEHHGYATYWSYRVTGELADVYLDSLANREEYRKALRLPPK